MNPQTEESKREDMNAFLTTFEEFDDLARARLAAKRGGYIDRKERITLFGIYVGRMG